MGTRELVGDMRRRREEGLRPAHHEVVLDDVFSQSERPAPSKAGAFRLWLVFSDLCL